jgi:hypothetical protein
MKSSTSILLGSLSVAAACALFGACASDDPAAGGQAGAGGSAAGMSTGGAGSGGQATGGAGSSTGGAGSGGQATAGGGQATGGGGSAGQAGSAGSSSAAGSAGAAGASTKANWTTMQFIVNNSCAGGGCHSGETKPALVGVMPDVLYTTLTTYKAALCGNRPLVTPGNPDESAFYLAQAGLCGAAFGKMPKGCVDNCTPPDYLDGIKQWIAAGAPKQ